MGMPKDGETSAETGSLAKKINDITTAATTIHSVTITKKGRYIIACIVYS